jgi:hypothetical protein
MPEKKQLSSGARKDEVVTREYTINLHKRLHGWHGTFTLPLYHCTAFIVTPLMSPYPSVEGSLLRARG